MTAQSCPADYQPVFALVQSHTGLRAHNSRLDELTSVVDSLLAAKHLKDVNDLILALMNTPFTEQLWQILIQAITVGETYFFRDEGQMGALRAYILPELIAERRKSGNKHLRLWSAGCASGEEPYSLLMLLHELLPDIGTWQITVLGTDINLNFLERARRGVYRASSFRNETPAYIQKRWFRHTHEGYQLDQSIRDKVTFMPLNLARDGFPLFDNFTMNMDLIVCRNVTIYFDQATVPDLVSRFYQALNQRGVLMVGHSELSTSMYRSFLTRTNEGMVYYQKDEVAQYQRESSLIATTPADRLSITYPAVVLPSVSEPVSPPPTAAVAFQDHDLEVVWSLAKQAADQEKWDEALAYLAAVETSCVFRPEFHYLRGLVQMAANNADKALWAWRQALYCDPTFALAHYSLGELYDRQGERKAAAQHWQHALTAIAQLEPQHRLLFSEDLTVEMLQGLLAYRVSTLAGQK